MVDLEKSFTLVCPKCGARSTLGLSEAATFRVRPSVYGWPCQVCECYVEMGTKEGLVLKKPRKLKPAELRKLRGKK